MKIRLALLQLYCIQTDGWSGFRYYTYVRTRLKTRLLIYLKHHKYKNLLLFFIAGFLSSDLRFRVLHVQIQGMDKIVETLDSIGITLFVMTALKKTH